MKAIFNGVEMPLSEAIKQLWTATKIYWRLRMNDIVMTKTHTVIMKALAKHYQVCVMLMENPDNIVLKYWKQTCKDNFQLHGMETVLLQDLDCICKERMEAEEWQKLKKQ